MAKTVETAVGADTKKLKAVPPFKVTSETKLLPLGPYVGVAKSEESATATPEASFTVTVQEMTSPSRTYVVPALLCPTHDNVDNVVALETLNVVGLPRIAVILVERFSVITNVAAMAEEAVTTKLNVDPPSLLVNEGIPLPESPYVGTVKSLVKPVVTPAAFLTVTVHEINSLTRTIVVKSPR